MANILSGKQMLAAKIIIFQNVSTSFFPTFLFCFVRICIQWFVFLPFRLNCLLKIHHRAPIQTLFCFLLRGYILDTIHLTHHTWIENVSYAHTRGGYRDWEGDWVRTRQYTSVAVCSHIKKLITFNWWNYTCTRWLRVGSHVATVMFCSVSFGSVLFGSFPSFIHN